MKKFVISLAVVLGLGVCQVFGQVAEQEDENQQQQQQQGVVGRIVDDLVESTRTVHEINKENVAAERDAFQARHAEATEPSPELVTFREAKGFKAKMRAIGSNIRSGSQKNSERERQRREEIQSHESYRSTLEGNREGREERINGE